MLANLSNRDRMTLAVGGSIALVLLLVFGVIAPYRDSLARLEIGRAHV